MAQIVMGDISERPSVLGLININSPLRLDAGLADALLAYAEAGQPVLLTPGIIMGITAPVTAAGALCQWLAELLGCVALTQVAHPGLPVIVGLGGFGSDMRDGGSGFGRPEQALGTIVGAQIARRLELPYRCSGAVTGAKSPDCRSGYERMMTAFAGWSAGANVCLQAAGALDCINSMCYEQFAIDLEVWAYLRRIAAGVEVTGENLAVSEIAALPSGYIGTDHTFAHFRDQLLTPGLAPPLSYERWRDSGAPTVAELAQPKIRDLLRTADVLPLPDDVACDLHRYVQTRRRQALTGRAGSQ